MDQVSIRKIRILKVGSRQASEAQERPPQGCGAQVYRTSVDRSELTLAQIQSGLI
jgi:hypothetical protein